MAARKSDGLLADPFHQATVPGDDIGVMVLNFFAVGGTQYFFGDGEANRIGNPLSQWASRGFNARRVAIFWMPGGFCTPLAEVFDLIERHIRISGQVEQGVEQHRSMPRRKNEAIAIWPIGRGGVKFHVLFEQNGGHIGHAHRHP